VGLSKFGGLKKATAPEDALIENFEESVPLMV
jgi:hypothetical protein